LFWSTLGTGISVLGGGGISSFWTGIQGGPGFSVGVLIRGNHGDRIKL